MNPSTKSNTFQLLVFGGILAAIKLVYLFFDFYNILDLVVFLAAGMTLGGKAPSNRRWLGLLLALPAFALCLLIVINLGYSSIVNGVGTSYAVSLIVIPVSTSIGIFINVKRGLRRRVEKK